MIPRTLAPVLDRRARDFPVVFLTGPRQSGKTTLARSTFPDFQYVSLEELATRRLVEDDPAGFLAELAGKSGAILDEVQNAPALFSYIQRFVDEERSGPLILTGSQNFLLSERISQTLAGRAAVLELLPFSVAELFGHDAREPDDLGRSVGHPPEAAKQRNSNRANGWSLRELLFAGLFPRIHDRGIEPQVWLDGYLRTYVERDVRLLSGVGDLDAFTRFVALCAGRTGGLLNLSSLGSDAGVSHVTAKKWISILRASYVLDLVQPHHQNFSKRIVKSPKLHFLDSGLLCFLLGIRTASELWTHPLRGSIFESFVYAELKKCFLHHGVRERIYFWRDRQGGVDLLIDQGTSRLPIEVKSGQTLPDDAFKELDRYVGISGDVGGVVVTGGDEQRRHRSHLVVPWWDIS